MSRHVSRRERWTSDGPERYRSVEGLLVRRFKGEWWAEVPYTLLAAAGGAEPLGAEEDHQDRLGPFKRWRNAMVEAERHVVALRNRHGERLRLKESSV